MGKEVLTCFIIWCGFPNAGSLLRRICGGSGGSKRLGRSGCISGGLRWPEVWEFQKFVGAVCSEKSQKWVPPFNGGRKNPFIWFAWV